MLLQTEAIANINRIYEIKERLYSELDDDKIELIEEIIELSIVLETEKIKD